MAIACMKVVRITPITARAIPTYIERVLKKNYKRENYSFEKYVQAL